MEDPKKKLLQVQQLLVLAAQSPSEHEAAAAALAAAKLIQKEGFRVVGKPEAPRPREWLEDLVTRAEPATRTSSPPSKTTWIPSRATREGTCLDCGGPYERNESVFWQPGRGCVHPECLD